MRVLDIEIPRVCARVPFVYKPSVNVDIHVAGVHTVHRRDCVKGKRDAGNVIHRAWAARYGDSPSA